MKNTHCFGSYQKMYLAVKFPDCPFDDLKDYFTALIHTKHSSAIQKEMNSDQEPGRHKVKEVSDLITETLYKFNKSKILRLLNHKPLAYLLLKFLEDE